MLLQQTLHATAMQGVQQGTLSKMTYEDFVQAQGLNDTASAQIMPSEAVLVSSALLSHRLLECKLLYTVLAGFPSSIAEQQPEQQIAPVHAHRWGSSRQIWQQVAHIYLYLTRLRNAHRDDLKSSPSARCPSHASDTCAAHELLFSGVV